MKLMTEKKLYDFLDTLNLVKDKFNDMELLYQIFNGFVKTYFTTFIEYQEKIIRWIIKNTKPLNEEPVDDTYDRIMFFEAFLSNTVITRIYNLYNLYPDEINELIFLFINLQTICFDFLIEHEDIIDWNLVVQSQDLTKDQFTKIQKNQSLYSTYEDYLNGQSLKNLYNLQGSEN